MKKDGTITIECKKDIIITAQDNVKVTATTADIEVKAAAGNVKINATAGLTAESPANTTIKGTKLSLEGAAMAELKAAIVKIN